MDWDDGSTVVHDWVNLPQGATIVSLWDCLHDTRLVSSPLVLISWKDQCRCFVKLNIYAHSIYCPKECNSFLSWKVSNLRE
jgi:hypothetical protein